MINNLTVINYGMNEIGILKRNQVKSIVKPMLGGHIPELKKRTLLN